MACYVNQSLIYFFKFYLLVFFITDVSKSSCAADGSILQVAECEVVCWAGEKYFFSSLSMFSLYLPIFNSYLRLDSYFCIAIAFPVMQRE